MTTKFFSQEMASTLQKSGLKVRERINSHIDSSRYSVKFISEKGYELIMDWTIEKTREFETEVDRALGFLFRPIEWAKNSIEDINKIKTYKNFVVEESYQEVEISRFEGEGGALQKFRRIKSTSRSQLEE